ncbi:MAG TPA: tetratricopeptide repeat protein [Candidatus Paceibacterota bacterium]|nr:tetratricopeptide repeat protein [Candidatus Paceibacterota bacterium]
MESDVTQSAVFFKTWAWAEAHRKQIGLGAAGVLVVGIGIGFFVWQQDQKQTAASQALSQIGSQSALTGKAAEPQAFVKVASEYPKTGGGERALLIAGTRFFSEGKYPEAQAQFQKFLSEYPNSDFTGQAALGIAASLEAQGKTPEAVKAYKDISDRRSNDVVAPQARLSLGRLYEAQGNLAQAKDTYEQLVRAEYGQFGQEAGMHLQELLTKNPSLVQPPVSSSNAPVLNLK